MPTSEASSPPFGASDDDVNDVPARYSGWFGRFMRKRVWHAGARIDCKQGNVIDAHAHTPFSGRVRIDGQTSGMDGVTFPI